jgi:alcohol dehydrogenase class IV
MFAAAADGFVSVEDFLEGVGGRRPSGAKLPFIAVPTTSGTGSEATKNAVLSRVGEGGYKRSIRHDNFVPDVAIVDPELTLSCPADVSAACGMDALTQLLESYVSMKSNWMTDALAMSGLKEIGGSLVPACTTSPNDIEVRGSMAYAALLSGITLANAGLGVVHGFASTIGGRFEVPHGVVCANVMGPVMRMTAEALRDGARGGDEKSAGFLRKFALIGAIFDGGECVEDTDIDRYADSLIEKILEWTEILKIPRLGAFGMTEGNIDGIVSKTDNKNNPVNLSRDEMAQIIRERL